MSKKIDFSSVGAVPVDDQPKKLDFSSVGAVPVEEAPAPKDPPGQLEAIGRGVQQGGTWGLGDEFSGGVEAAMDKLRQWGIDPTTSIFDGMKADGPAVSETNAKLAAQGVKGDIGPKSTLEAYRQGRDSNRAENEAAQSANPWSYGAGNILGAVMTSPVAPQKLMTAFGPAAKGANLTTRMAQSALNGIAPGAVAGLATSNADLTKGDILNAAGDTVNGAATGFVVSPALTAAGAGVGAVWNGGKKAFGKLVPKVTKADYAEGLKGVDTTTPEWSKDVDNQTNQVVDETAGPFLEKLQAHSDQVADLESQLAELQQIKKNSINAPRESLTKANKAQQDAIEANIEHVSNKLEKLKGLQTEKVGEGNKMLATQNAADDVAANNNISEIDNNLSEIKARQQASQDLEKSRQVATNKADIDNINHEAVKTAGEVEEYAGAVKTGIRKAFDRVDEAAEATGVAPRSDRVLEQFKADLNSNMSLHPEAIERIKTNIEDIYKNNPNDLAAYKSLKRELFGLTTHKDEQVARAAKAAYANLKDDYAKALTNAGFDGIANEMIKTNSRWRTILDLEDNFINRATEFDPLTQSTSRKTLRTMESLAEKNKNQIDTAQAFRDKLGLVDPEGSQPMIDKLTELAQREQDAKAFKPNINSNVDDSELLRLKELLAQAKANKAAPKDTSVPQLPDSRISQLESELAMHQDELAATKKFDANDALPDLTGQKVNNLQAQLDQVKATDPLTGKVLPPGETNGLNLPNNSQGIKDDLTKSLPKYETESSNLVSKNKLDRIFDLLRQVKGDEYVDQIQAKLGPLNEKIAIQSAHAGQGDMGIPKGAAGLTLKALGGVNKAANALGRGVHAVDNAFNKPLFSNKSVDSSSKEFLQEGVKYLSEAKPENIQTLSEGLSQAGPSGARYAKVLTEAANKNTTSKNAIIFGLMQQPDFRALINKLWESSSDESVK